MKIIIWKKGVRGRISLFFLFFSLSFAYFYISNLFAQQIVLKCATIAPENSPWAELVRKASQEIQEKTGGLVKMEWYFSSIAGDEPDIAKKLKEGKLDCAGLTGNGISYLVPPIRILELPFFLKNVKEVDFIKQRSMKLFQNIANDYNVKLIWISDLGFVYIFSKQPLKKLDDIKGKTVWVWKGDYLAEFIGKFFQSEFQIKPFPIPVQDVKSQLDQIQILYNTPYALNVFGWDSGVKYILSQPLNFSFTSLIVSKNSMDKIPPNYQNIVEEVLRKYLDILTKMNRESDNKAIDILKRKGVEMIDFSQDEVKKAEDIFREKVWLALKDKLYPSWLLTQLLTDLSAFRVGTSK
ncbi:MAG: TRAP transporter substrate-binding protein DctP [Candidatus Calescibacterium sp.]